MIVVRKVNAADILIEGAKNFIKAARFWYRIEGSNTIKYMVGYTTCLNSCNQVITSEVNN